MHELLTERLRLRAWAPEDLDALAGIHADPQIAQWLGGAWNREQAQTALHGMTAHVAEHGWGLYAVCLKGEDKPIGVAGLQTIKPGLPLSGIEAAWRLLPEYWGQGYITEAMRAVLQEAPHRHGITEVLSFTAVSNLRSQAVMRRLGFIAEPDRDFDHPRLAVEHPLRRHVVWRWRG